MNAAREDLRRMAAPARVIQVSAIASSNVSRHMFDGMELDPSPIKRIASDIKVTDIRNNDSVLEDIT